jgi:hypothetical protein
MPIAVLLLLLSVVLGACSTADPPSESAAVTPATDSLVGTITFGSVESPENSFRLDEEIHWRALLAAPVDGTKVNLVITESDGERELFGYEQFITYPGTTTLVNHMPLGRFLRQPGAYVMRYVTIEGEAIAEGEFRLVSN